MTIEEAKMVLGKKAFKLTDEEIILLIELVNISLDNYEKQFGLRGIENN